MSNESTLTFRIVAEDNASAVFDQVGQSAQQMGDSVKGTSNDIDSVGAAATSSAGNVKSFGGALASVGLSIGSAAAGIVSFVKSFDQLDNAMDKAEAAQTKLASASANVEKAQSALATAIAKFGPNSSQAAQAAEKLDLALRREADAAARAENASENVGFAMANAATGAVQFIAGLAGIGQAVSTISANMGTLKSGFSGIGSSISNVIGTLTGLGTAAAGASGSLSKLSPAFSGFSTSASSSNAAVASLGGALSNFSGTAANATNATSGLIGILGRVAPVVAIAFGAFAVVDTAISGIEALGAAAESNFGKAAKAIDDMWKKMEVGTLVGPQFDFLFKLAGIDMSKVTQQLANLGDGTKEAGQDAATAQEGFNSLSAAVDAFAAESKTASTEAPKLFDEIVAGANKAGIAIETISGADIKDIFGSMAEGAGPAAQSVDLVAAAFDAYSKAARDGKAETDPMAAAQKALAGDLNNVGTAANQAAGNMSELRAQYFSTLNQIRQGAAVGPGGIVGSREALERMGIPSSQIFEGAAAERAAAAQRGFNSPPPTMTPKTDNTQLNTGVDQAKTKTNEIPATKNTALSTTGSPQVQQQASAIAQAFGAPAYPDLKNTLVTETGGSIVAGVAGMVGKAFAAPGYPDNKNTKVTETGGSIVAGVAGMVGKAFSAPNYPDNKNTKVTETGGSVVAGVAATISKNLSAPNYPDNKNTKISESGGSAVSTVVQGITKSFSVPNYPDNKNTKISESGGSIVSEMAKGITNLFKPSNYPDNKKTTLSATDQATPTIDNVQRGLDQIKSKTVVITVHAQAGAGMSAQLRASLGLRHGGTHIISSPTAVRVGEGFHPEMVQRFPVTMAAKGFDGFVNRPTMFMAGEAGPELVNVIPLKGGSNSGSDIAELVQMLRAWISTQRRQGGMNANLFVDGQHLATSVSKYTGTKSYGDR